MIDESPPTGRTAAGSIACTWCADPTCPGGSATRCRPKMALVDDDTELTRLRAEVERLKSKARRFKGWRMVYEMRRTDGTWREIRRRPESSLRDVRYSVQYLRREHRTDRIRNVRIMRVYRKPKGRKESA